jgi:hypothetical protein
MSDQVWVGYPRKRTPKTAMAEAVRMQEQWWAGIGRPGIHYRALSADRRSYTDGPSGWVVTIERVR